MPKARPLFPKFACSAYSSSSHSQRPADEPAFTLEDGTWERIIAFHREGKDAVHQDYATGSGAADLVILESDPTNDLTAFAHPIMTIRAGQVVYTKP